MSAPIKFKHPLNGDAIASPNFMAKIRALRPDVATVAVKIAPDQAHSYLTGSLLKVVKKHLYWGFHFTAVPPGAYTLTATAFNADGDTVGSPYTISITLAHNVSNHSGSRFASPSIDDPQDSSTVTSDDLEDFNPSGTPGGALITSVKVDGTIPADLISCDLPGEEWSADFYNLTLAAGNHTLVVKDAQGNTGTSHFKTT